MSRNNVHSDGRNKLIKANLTESFAKTSGEAFVLAVQMWQQRCSEVPAAVLKDTGNCWPAVRGRSPLPREGSEAAAEQQQRQQQNTLRSATTHPLLTALQPFLQERSVWVKIAGAKPGIKTASHTLPPAKKAAGLTQGAGSVPSFPLAAPAVQGLLLNLQPLQLPEEPLVSRREQSKKKPKKILCSVGFLRPLRMHNVFPQQTRSW